MNSMMQASLQNLVVTPQIILTADKLEELFHAKNASIPMADWHRDLSNISEISQRISTTENLAEKLDLYLSQYRSLFKQIRLKYSDFLPLASLKDFMAYEKHIDGLYEFMIIQGLMLSSLASEKLIYEKYQILYTSMVKLSSWLDEYQIYFSNDLINQIQIIVTAILTDQDLQAAFQSASHNQYSESELNTYVLALKNTTHAVLSKIGSPHERQVRLYRKLSEDSIFFQELQIRNNQGLMNWLARQSNQSS